MKEKRKIAKQRKMDRNKKTVRAIEDMKEKEIREMKIANRIKKRTDTERDKGREKGGSKETMIIDTGDKNRKQNYVKKQIQRQIKTEKREGLEKQ